MKREISIEAIERGLADADWSVRAAAMNACAGKDVPLEIIERGLADTKCDVREAAMNACKERGIPVPIIRTFEPPERVYKKCLCNVIVVAEIPSDAQVRGKAGRKCRADKAIIKEIIGDFCGDKVGVSIYDKKTMYFEGDEIVIDNFDYSNQECSVGFHFFCTRQEAENY